MADGARLEFHPLANLFPLIEGAEFDELVADIRANGFRGGEEIVLHEGKILDGRNRYRALCHLADSGELEIRDIDPATSWAFAQFSAEGMDGLFSEAEIARGPLAYVISKNLRRRHMNESQRALVAAKLANLEWGGKRRGAPEARPGSDEVQAANLPVESEAVDGRDKPGHEGEGSGAVSQTAAAGLLNVSERSVRDARVVATAGIEELVRAVEQGEAPVSAARVIARLDPDEQKKLIAEIAAQPDTRRAFRGVVKDLRRDRQDEKRERREERERDLGARQMALPDKRYGVIVADPEWRFEPYSRDTGMDRAPDNHYPTSPTEIIAARPVGDIAADDAALFLCATAPMLPQALAVMAAWGFEYKTHAVWFKVRPGLARGPGYWFTGEHELVLLGTRGRVPAPAPGVQFPSVFDAPVGEHSEKPSEIYEIIEAYFPNLPKIELNARRARAGWDAWGLEAPPAALPPHDPETGEVFEDPAADAVRGAPDDRAGPAASASRTLHEHRTAEPVASPTDRQSEPSEGPGRNSNRPEESPSKLLLRPDDAAAGVLKTAPAVSDLEIPNFLRRGDAANAWAKRGETA